MEAPIDGQRTVTGMSIIIGKKRSRLGSSNLVTRRRVARPLLLQSRIFGFAPLDPDRAAGFEAAAGRGIDGQ